MNVADCRRHLQGFDLKRLFNELGWEHPGADQRIEADGHVYELTAVAEKRGVHVFRCGPGPDGRLPEYPTRRKIEKRLTRLAHEHLMIFVDAAQTVQVWHWVARWPGRPDQPREYVYDTQKSGDAIVQKLLGIEFPFSEEESVTLAGAERKIRDAFDRDKVTRKFYDQFKCEHKAFLGFIEGIADKPAREWYASLMLNRLMFVYFIQKKGFLDGDANYLRNRLARVREREGNGKFLDFYRSFLLALFHEGFAKLPEHWNVTPEQREMIGAVPYLNGGLFDVHELEESHPDIRIPDEAFETVFRFLDQYEWTLDDRPIAKGNEINPDVLGYIFEKYINQKQMGAYYTKEDITEYIGKNTIIPYLFDAARTECRIAFKPDSSLWLLLRDNPDAYLYPAMKKGVIAVQGGTVPLPDEIAQGIGDPSRRGGWERPVWPDSPDNALPTETWREYAARRKHCLEVRKKLRDCEGPELLRALYEAVSKVTVLDPACGSGAFLFAALNILEPLYEACLDRMQAFIDDLERSGKPHSPKKFEYFRKTLAEVERHPNRTYFILKSIVVQNLYGVDLMEEAVEICKLRLFLKLVAQVEDVASLEPLPDIDFNIRAGNTLVGYATREDVRAALGGQQHLGFDDALHRIEEQAEEIDRKFQNFRKQQTTYGGEITPADKKALRLQTSALAEELDRYLADQYKVGNGKRSFKLWLASHKPFHWFVEFHEIMASGGFHAVIGNPPWREYTAVKKQYRIRGFDTERCGNLHGIFTERAIDLRSWDGRLSFIVQLPLASSSRMASVREELTRNLGGLFVLAFDDRPGKLFEGLQHCRSIIFVSTPARKNGLCDLYTTRYQRWGTAVRPCLFEKVQFVRPPGALLHPGAFPKYGSSEMASVFHKVREQSDSILGAMADKTRTDSYVFYQEAMQYWAKVVIGLPYYAKNGQSGPPAHGRHIFCADQKTATRMCAVLHSSLFYLYFIAYSDCFHLSDALVRAFSIPSALRKDVRLVELGRKLQDDLTANAERKTISTKDGSKIEYAEFFASKSKAIIDQIDATLAKHYGFTDEELDFIVNYDFKYRMGGAGGAREQ